MHGIVLQMVVFILRNYGGLIVFCVVTVLLEYLTDCSIRVSRSSTVWRETLAPLKFGEFGD